MDRRFCCVELHCLCSAFFLQPIGNTLKKLKPINNTLEKLKLVTSPKGMLASSRIGNTYKVTTATKLWVLSKSRGHKKPLLKSWQLFRKEETGISSASTQDHRLLILSTLASNRAKPCTETSGTGSKGEGEQPSKLQSSFTKAK